ncbi:MAG TPA: hypothetical protein VIV11_26315 [Kofleriaceae bacterium]
MMRVYTLAFLFAIGCGGTGPMTMGDDEPIIDAPGGMADAYIPPSGYTKLIGRTWTLQAGQTDIYRCVRVTVPADTYITNINAQAPNGTHHTVLSIASGMAAGADGEQDCTVSTLGMQMLYASGVGTSPLDFPSGVGVRIPAGTQIHLNLHLYNAGDEALTGESAIWVKSQPTAPPMLAEMVFAGPLQLSIPAGAQGHNVSGSCTMNSSYKLFALWPHMHKAAVHQKIELIRGTTTVLHDMPYMFEEQKYWPQTPEIQLMTGDRIRVTCTYNNNTGSTINWGDSSDQEMCFGGMYRYPSAGASLFCFQ